MSANKGKTFDVSMKLLMVGDSGVGKSSLLLRFVDDQFNATFVTTVGIDFKIKNIVLDERKVRLQIWDTAGQERFRTITTAYYRGAMGIVIVYDVCNRLSFDKIEAWYKTVQEHASDDLEVLIVGNKCDEEEARVVSTQQGEELANKLGVSFIEASAKSGLNINDVFYSLASDILANNKSIVNAAASESVNVNQKTEKAGSNCC